MNETTPLGRVMLIDDEEFDQKMYRRIISRSGMAHEILSFTLASDALDYLSDPKNPQIDLILLDINMPRMNGFEFLDEVTGLLGRDFDVPVIMMLTTSLLEADRKRAVAVPAVRAFFNKPLQAEQLEEAAEIVQETLAANRSGAA